MTRGIKKDLRLVRARIRREISGLASGHTGPGPNYSGGLSSEGYVGGYNDAVTDVLLALNNVKPRDRYGFWVDFEEK